MKNLFTFFWLVVSVYISHIGKAQNVSETIDEKFKTTGVDYSKIKIELGDGNYLLFAQNSFFVYGQVKRASNLKSNLQEIQSYFENIKDSLDNYTNYYIKYERSKIIKEGIFSLKPVESDAKHYKNENDKIIRTKVGANKIQIIDYRESYGYSVDLIINNLEDLESIIQMPIDEYIDAVIQDFDNLGRKYKRGVLDMVYKVDNDKIIRSENNTRVYDYISLEIGVALNLIRDRPVPEFLFNVRFNFHDVFYIGALLNQQHLFERDENGKYQTQFNYFIGPEMGVNIPQSRRKPYYLGISTEYLIARQGNFYDRDTFKIALHLDDSKTGLNFSPQLYFNFDNGGSFLGIQLAKVF